MPFQVAARNPSTSFANRFGDTGSAVRSSCANVDTRNSSTSQRNSSSAGSLLRVARSLR